MSNSAAYRDFQRAASAYRAGDSARWVFAFYAARVVGSYTDGSRQLAELIGGVSVDTVERAAHAYEMYCKLRDYGVDVRKVRGCKFIFIAHFLVLHSRMRRYNLPIDVCADYLGSVYQGAGEFSCRDLAARIDSDHGPEQVLSYDTAKARKAIERVLSRPDLTSNDRRVLQIAWGRLGRMKVRQDDVIPELSAPIGQGVLVR